MPFKDDYNLNFKFSAMSETSSTQSAKIIHSAFRRLGAVTMSHKVTLICLKISIVVAFLLLLQPPFSQYNRTELENELKAKQKLLGADAVAMLWKGDSLVHTKEMGKF